MRLRVCSSKCAAISFFSTLLFALSVAICPGDVTDNVARPSTATSNASGNHSTSIGEAAFANGDFTMAIGDGYSGGNTAAGVVGGAGYAFALGTNAQAVGRYSFSVGNGSDASADYAVAFGLGVRAAQSQFVIGQYNVSNTMTANDLFIIGNGTNAANHNAFTVDSSGNTVVSGTLTVNGTATANGQPIVTIPNLTTTGLAIGSNTTAVQGATAFGQQAIANGDGALAIGNNVYADSGGVTIGNSIQYNGHAHSGVSVGSNISVGGTGTNVAFGAGLDGYAIASIVLGIGSQINGANETVVGYGSSAVGDCASVFGYMNSALANYSTALGNNTITTSYGETIVGQYNSTASPQTASSWSATDELFVVGNGTDSQHTSNAFVVYKNGVVQISQIVVQGDIDPGPFTVQGQ